MSSFFLVTLISVNALLQYIAGEQDRFRTIMEQSKSEEMIIYCEARLDALKEFEHFIVPERRLVPHLYH